MRLQLDAASRADERMSAVVTHRRFGEPLALARRSDVPRSNADDPPLLLQDLLDLDTAVHLKRCLPHQELARAVGIGGPRLDLSSLEGFRRDGPLKLPAIEEANARQRQN